MSPQRERGKIEKSSSVMLFGDWTSILVLAGLGNVLQGLWVGSMEVWGHWQEISLRAPLQCPGRADPPQKLVRFSIFAPMLPNRRDVSPWALQPPLKGDY